MTSRATRQAVAEAYSAVAQPYIDLCGNGQTHEADADLIRRHLTGLDGPVLDLGCGPGHWTAFLHEHGAAVSGLDLVPEFLAHARATCPGLTFRQGSMADAEGPVAGILAWYSAIHLPPPQLDDQLVAFRQLLEPDGVLVLGFFDSADGVAAFDHAVITAYRWPVDVMAQRLQLAGFTEVERSRHHRPERPDRAYAALAVRALG